MSPFLQTALPILEMLVGVAFPGAAPVIADVQALAAGISTKDPGVIATDATTVITAAQTAGLLGSGTLINQAATELGAIASFVSDVKSNQTAVIAGNTSLFGVKGVYAFIPSASDQGVSLGLS